MKIVNNNMLANNYTDLTPGDVFVTNDDRQEPSVVGMVISDYTNDEETYFKWVELGSGRVYSPTGCFYCKYLCNATLTLEPTE